MKDEIGFFLFSKATFSHNADFLCFCLAESIAEQAVNNINLCFVLFSRHFFLNIHKLVKKLPRSYFYTSKY